MATTTHITTLGVFVSPVALMASVIDKLKPKREKLQAIYLDPDVGMTKTEYIELKTPIDEQIKAASLEVETTSQELQRIPNAEDLKSLEQFASNIVSALGDNLEISPGDKRQIMQMINLKVLIAKDGNIKLEGWFTPESDGLLSIPSVCLVLLALGKPLSRERYREPSLIWHSRIRFPTCA